MNNRGSVLFYGFMLGVTILVLALALAPAIGQFTSNAMNNSTASIGLNCTTTSDNFVKAACIVTDVGQFYFIGALIFIAGVVITARYYFGGGGVINE